MPFALRVPRALLAALVVLGVGAGLDGTASAQGTGGSTGGRQPVTPGSPATAQASATTGAGQSSTGGSQPVTAGSCGKTGTDTGSASVSATCK